MKRIISLLLLVVAFTLNAHAQKFALIDMEYIMGNIPAYERANEQLNQVSKKMASRGGSHRQRKQNAL